jgi:PTS system N-acetylglucosamine-specific IIC component
MMKYLQKLGKALMLPVAALPVAGILMGVGYLLAPAVMGVPGAEAAGAAYTVGFLLIKAGGGSHRQHGLALRHRRSRGPRRRS